MRFYVRLIDSKGLEGFVLVQVEDFKVMVRNQDGFKVMVRNQAGWASCAHPALSKENRKRIIKAYMEKTKRRAAANG